MTRTTKHPMRNRRLRGCRWVPQRHRT